jgi:hypothetical protein
LACRQALGRFAAKDRSGLQSGALLACLDELVRVSKQTESLTAAVAEEARRRGAAAKSEGVDVESHLRGTQDLPAAQVRRLVEQGKALRPFEIVNEAAQQGTVGPAQAEVCAKELKDFPAEQLGDRALREVEAELVARAGSLGAKALGLKARDLVDQARRKAGMGGRADRLNREHARAYQERFLSFKPDGQAMVISGRCPVEDGVRIKNRLTSAAAALRRERTDPAQGGARSWAGQTGDAAAGGHMRSSFAGTGGLAPCADGSGRLWDPANVGGIAQEPFAASMMDALAAMADSSPEDGAPLKAGKPARFVITMTKDQLDALNHPAGHSDQTPVGAARARQSQPRRDAGSAGQNSGSGAAGGSTADCGGGSGPQGSPSRDGLIRRDGGGGESGGEDRAPDGSLDRDGPVYWDSEGGEAGGGGRGTHGRSGGGGESGSGDCGRHGSRDRDGPVCWDSGGSGDLGGGSGPLSGGGSGAAAGTTYGVGRREGSVVLPGAILQETGDLLAPEAVNLAACDAEWVGMLIGSMGEPLDVGRATRAIPASIRLALEERDRGCVFPGCGIGPDGCEAHHVDKWALGCPTSLAKLVLVCHQHHRILEPAMKLADGTPWRPGIDNPAKWRAEIDPVHRHPVVIPPARVDPQRRPLLNDRIKLKLETLGVLRPPEQGSLGPG